MRDAARTATGRTLLFAIAGSFGAAVLEPSLVHAATPNPSTRALQKQLEERDALIRDLQRRVESLERTLSPPTATAEAKEATTEKTEAAPAAEPDESEAPKGAPPPAAPGEAAPAAKPKGPAPGKVTATEEEAERALERTLTAEGVLLLPYGQLQLEPSFTYTRRESNSVPVVSDGSFAIQPRVRTNEFQPSLSASAGLPFDSQLELSLPVNIVEQQVQVGGARNQSDTGHGLGDVSVGIAKTVLREKGWQPDVIARVTWDTGSGETTNNNVNLDAGFDEITGQLVALKRQDPLAFFVSAAYQKTLENNHFEPGDAFLFSGGAFLATSPETSLQLSLSQTFTEDSRFKGRVNEGSDTVQSVLNLGISSILARNVLLQVVAGVGLTDELPDYSFSVSLPITFSIPTP